MITKDTPIGTRVIRNSTGHIGTVVSIREYRPDDGEDVGAVGVYLDHDDQVWSGTFEAWDLADGDLDAPDRPSGDEVFTMIREAIAGERQAGYEVARYIYKHDDDDSVALARKNGAEAEATRKTVAMWQALYDWASR